ncbi:MAG: 6-carboxytetrahydropterin synthase [Rhodospirillaceae bacterium]
MTFTVTRLIEIDAGHRIMTHGSKCRHLHGHRYQIEATAESAGLHSSGEQTDMVLDFSFLKEEMLAEIDGPCDHGFIASCDDKELLSLFAPADKDTAAWIFELCALSRQTGFAETDNCRFGTKLYLINGQPTAEFLARHWFERLAPRIIERSGGLAVLKAIVVRETPNCRAEYRPG